MPNEAHLHLESGLRFSADTGSGFKLELDSTVEDVALTAPTPMELQLVALGGCTAMDVISILRKMRQDVVSYDVRLTGERATEHPRVYTSIVMMHTLRGKGMVEANVRRAVQLSMERYCPVFGMLYPKVDIRETYEIVDEASESRVTGTVTLDQAGD